MPAQTQNPGSSAVATPDASAPAAAVSSPAPKKAVPARPRAASPAAPVPAPAPQTALSAKELQDVSLAFLDGLPDEKAVPAATNPPAEAAAPDAATVPETAQPEAAAPVTDEASPETTGEITDPGDAHVEQVFESETQDGPKWLSELMDKVKDGKPMPKWGPKRIKEIVDKALEKNAAYRELEARNVELEEQANALTTREVPKHDVRGALAKVTDAEQLKQHQNHAQSWIDWATSVTPDESGLVLNPVDPNGEMWTLEQVHRKLAEENARARAAAAQLDFLAKSKPAKEEVLKVLPAMLRKETAEHKIAQRFLDSLPWLEQEGNRDAILARLVLGEQAIQKRANGVHTVDVTTAKPAAPATKTTASKPAAVSTVPVKSGNAPFDITELRNRKAAGDMSVQRQIDEAFLGAA